MGYGTWCPKLHMLSMMRVDLQLQILVCEQWWPKLTFDRFLMWVKHRSDPLISSPPAQICQCLHNVSWQTLSFTAYNIATVCNKLNLPELTKCAVRSGALLMSWFLRKGRGSSLANTVIHFLSFLWGEWRGRPMRVRQLCKVNKVKSGHWLLWSW